MIDKEQGAPDPTGFEVLMYEIGAAEGRIRRQRRKADRVAANRGHRLPVADSTLAHHVVRVERLRRAVDAVVALTDAVADMSAGKCGDDSSLARALATIDRSLKHLGDPRDLGSKR